MYSDLSKLVKICPTCQERKILILTHHTSLLQPILVEKPLQCVQLDINYMPQPSCGYLYLLVIVEC